MLVGKEGKGFTYIMNNFNHERFSLCAQTLRQVGLTHSCCFYSCFIVVRLLFCVVVLLLLRYVVQRSHCVGRRCGRLGLITWSLLSSILLAFAIEHSLSILLFFFYQARVCLEESIRYARMRKCSAAITLLAFSIKHSLIIHVLRTLPYQARVCLEESIRYARMRKTFGKRLADHQVGAITRVFRLCLLFRCAVCFDCFFAIGLRTYTRARIRTLAHAHMHTHVRSLFFTR
jgi:hypothetical protein